MNYCLFIQSDYEGFEVCFTEEQRRKKEAHRPELRDPDFINGRMKEAICSPHFVYADFAHPTTRRVYYIKEFVVNSKAKYTKVVVSIDCSPRFVITAYRPDYVKERNKTELIYGNDS